MKIKSLRIKLFKCSSAWQCFKKYWKQIILGLVIFSGIGTAIGVYLYFNSESYYRSELDFTELYEKAKSGNAKAQYVLSSKYAKDEYSEMYWLESAANNGYAEAAKKLGYRYYGEDKEKSLYWYNKAYALGADVSLWLARLYADKGYYQLAIRFYKETDNYNLSYRELAQLYDKKLKDGKEAEKWYLKEIDEEDDSYIKSQLIFELIRRYDYDYNDVNRESNVKNNAQQMKALYHQLGMLLGKSMSHNAEQALAESYLTGKVQYSKDYDSKHIIVEKDVDKGIKILERLATYKGESAYILGEIYKRGYFSATNLGIKIDLEKAKYYYKVACDRYYDCTDYQRLNNNETN
ncbi:hypothetical protein [Ursidibacter sp. B-7004-1]